MKRNRIRRCSFGCALTVLTMSGAPTVDALTKNRASAIIRACAGTVLTMSGAPTVRALPPTAPVPCAAAERCAPPCESWAHSRIFRSIRAALPAARLQSPGTSFLTCLHHDTSHRFRHILSHGLPDRRVVASDSSACNPPFACCPDELYQIAHQRGEQRPLSVPHICTRLRFLLAHFTHGTHRG